MPTNPRGYMSQYAKKHPEKWNNKKEIRKRVERNRARALFAKKMGVSPKALNGDVDHAKPLRSGGKTTINNLRLLSPRQNRGWRKMKNK